MIVFYRFILIYILGMLGLRAKTGLKACKTVKVGVKMLFLIKTFLASLFLIFRRRLKQIYRLAI